MTNKEAAMNIYTVNKAKDMYYRMLNVIQIIQERKEISNVNLNTEVKGYTKTILEVLESCGKIRSEVRKEETIIKENYGYHRPLDKDGFEIEGEPETITITYKGQTATIQNPFIKKTHEFGEYKKRVQVRRKYWIWVE